MLSADFVAEARDPAALIATGPPEIAIAGRSNVGKSTLINRLAARRSLARTSKTPGRTRGLVFYDLELKRPDGARAPLRFVDLPGYGYAQVSKAERRSWQRLVEGYVAGRGGALRLFLVLVDARRAPADEEQQLLEWLTAKAVPHAIVPTKTDKLAAAERGAVKTRVRAALRTEAPVLPVSAETGEGIDRLWGVILRAGDPVTAP